MRNAFFLLPLFLAGCATLPGGARDAPTGARIERSGFATILGAEPAPLPERPTFSRKGEPLRTGPVTDDHRFVRLFPQAAVDPEIVLTSLTVSRIQLVDGCFRLAGRPDAPLVIFARSTILGRDREGYLTVASRSEPERAVRIGEWAGYGGWNQPEEDWPSVRALRAACGAGRIVNVGQPSSYLIPYDPVETATRIARRQGIRIEEAWSELRDCLAELGREGVRSRRVPQLFRCVRE